jgi:hypothetical protein
MVGGSPQAPGTGAQQDLLIGLLVDVSGSMRSSIRNPSGDAINRLESFRASLDELVARGGRLSKTEQETPQQVARLFAYGFGFGNPLALAFGGSPLPVRDLLELPGEETSTVPIDVLSNRWSEYRDNVESMALEMFGDTPMAAGLSEAGERFGREVNQAPYDQTVLFLLSDGQPTDASFDEIVKTARELQDQGILIVSCYVTDEDLTESRRLYSSPQDEWSEAARLMFECASVLPNKSPYERYMKEYSWSLDDQGRLFAQINESQTLTEFMNLLLSPLKGSERPEEKKPEAFPF